MGAREAGLLEEQLEPELVVLGGGKAAIDEVIETDEEPTGMRAQGGADDGAGEAADDGAKDKRPDARGRWTGQAGSLQIGGRIG